MGTQTPSGGRLCESQLARGDDVRLVDVETTATSPLNGDRIIEVAVVRLSRSGKDEWATLINPLRDVGLTHIQGLSGADLIDAPMSQETCGDLLEVGAAMRAPGADPDLGVGSGLGGADRA